MKKRVTLAKMMGKKSTPLSHVKNKTTPKNSLSPGNLMVRPLDWLNLYFEKEVTRLLLNINVGNNDDGSRLSSLSLIFCTVRYEQTQTTNKEKTKTIIDHLPTVMSGGGDISHWIYIASS